MNLKKKKKSVLILKLVSQEMSGEVDEYLEHTVVYWLDCNWPDPVLQQDLQWLHLCVIVLETWLLSIFSLHGIAYRAPCYPGSIFSNAGNMKVSKSHLFLLVFPECRVFLSGLKSQIFHRWVCVSQELSYCTADACKMAGGSSANAERQRDFI